MSEKMEQYQEELNDLVESTNFNYEKMSRASNDYCNEVRRYLKKVNDYVDVVYNEGLNDAWECAKKIVKMDWNTKHEVLKDPSMRLYNLLSNHTPEEAIKMVKEYEDNNVTRRSIIKTKLDEIKDMFDDPATNEEIIKILNEREDKDEISI